MENNIKAFASYRLPGEKNFYTIYTEQLPQIVDEIDVLSENRFYISSFDNKTISFIPFDNILINETFDYNPIINRHHTNETKRYQFIKQVELAVKKIKQNEFQKVVLSKIKKQEKPKDFNWQNLFLNLINEYPNAFVYCYYSELTGFWMGATPELFLQKNNGGFHTVALAGTKKIDEEWTPKEKEEQLFVTDFITKSIREKSKKLDISPVHDIEIGAIKHLETNIDFDLYLDEDINQIIPIINPTPAVCGTPQEEAYHFISHIEEHDRSFYTGLIGPVGVQDQTDLFVNLRCMQVDEEELFFYAGCGITKNSNPIDEWNETEDKIKVLSQFI